MGFQGFRALGCFRVFLGCLRVFGVLWGVVGCFGVLRVFRVLGF